MSTYACIHVYYIPVVNGHPEPVLLQPKSRKHKEPLHRETHIKHRSLDGETVDVCLSALQCLVGLVSTVQH